MGAVAIDGQSKEEGARLRWFIVAPDYRGLGIGQLLMQQAIDFCHRANFSQVYLWTFAGLTAARRLYDHFGFVLQEEHTDAHWGARVTHQKFALQLRR